MTEYSSIYNRSYALVIGIDDYQDWPLYNCVNDATAVAELLRDDMGFDEVELLLDAQATREAITDYVDLHLTKTEPDDRVLIYYAGHGASRPDASGGRVGYLRTYGAPTGQYGRWLAMQTLTDSSRFIPAKHILFVMDACFSGLAFTRSNPDYAPDRFVEDLMTRRAVWAIAAGKDDQPVTDGGPGGHSLFTGLLIDRVRAQDGLLTGSDLQQYLYKTIGQHTGSQQTPHGGPLLGDKQGDFIFWQQQSAPNLPVEVVDALNSYDLMRRRGAVAVLQDLLNGDNLDEAAAARKKLEELIDDDSRTISQSAQKALDRSSSGAAESDPSLAGVVSADDAETEVDVESLAWALVESGLAKRQSGDIEGAIADYNEALRLKPDYALAYNTRGYAYSVRGDRDLAMQDYSEAIRIEPNFAIAYVNRGFGFFSEGDFVHALEDYDAAVRSAPRYVTAYNNRGEIHFAMGQYYAAAADFEDALRLDPDYEWALGGLAAASHALGRFDEAVAQWKMLIERDDIYRSGELAGRKLNWTPQMTAEAEKLVARLS